MRIPSRRRRLHSRNRVGGEGRWAEITGRGDVSRQAWQTEDWGPNSRDGTSSIRPGLLSAWANLAHDPGKVAAGWVRHGAPAGIVSQPLLAGVFPLAQLNDEGVLEPEDW